MPHQNIIKLQLNKPKNWNWELSTLNTNENIRLPIIQLYDNKKKLLVQTSPYERRSWNGYNLKEDTNKDKLNTSDRIKIREFLLKKSSDKNSNLSKLKSDILNNNILTKEKVSRSQSDVNVNKSYKLQRSFKRTSLRDIPTILEEKNTNVYIEEVFSGCDCDSPNKNSFKNSHSIKRCDDDDDENPSKLG